MSDEFIAGFIFFCVSIAYFFDNPDEQKDED